VAEVVLDANAVAQVITFVAPGFLARMGYRARYPGPDRSAGEALIIAVVASLPLVALANAVLPGLQKPTQLGYVALLLGLGLLVGYITALARGTTPVKQALARLDYRIQPEGTIYAQTLRHMSDDGQVVIELKDGRRIWGCPRSGPQSKDDGIAELYLTYAKAMAENGEWKPVGAGIIVPLGEVSTICLDEEPTGAPAAE
jgi:hypothetical protein